MEPDWWLEVESTYVERIAQRQELHRKHGKIIIDCAPAAEAACVELMEMVVQFLCTRYPNQFKYDPFASIFSNYILGTSCRTKAIDPLKFLMDNVPEDFLLVLEDEKTGLYHLRAGVSCSAVGWNMMAKMGKPLHEIHQPVPDYKDRLQLSLDR